MCQRPHAVGHERIALLVLGVGRSGTSALTRVLSLLGAALPNNLLGPNGGNERGHWEPLRIMALNDEILKIHNSAWSDCRAFPKDWFASAEADAFANRAAGLVEGEYQGAPLIVIKEPRICRLVPLYMTALDRTDYSPRAIIPLRHPSEIAKSLQRRDGLDPLTCELIWIRHTLETEASTRRCPRVWVNYDELLSDWRGVLERIATALDIVWPISPRDAEHEVEAFLEPSLRHFDVRKSQSAESIGQVAAKLWEAAQEAVTGNETVLRARCDEVRSIVDDIDRLASVRLSNDRARSVSLAAKAERLAAEVLAMKAGRPADPVELK